MHSSILQRTCVSNLTILQVLVILVLLLVSAGYWYLYGLQNLSLHVDLARDLHALSELWIGNVVWLGPQLRVGFPISPLYFYLLFPGIIISAGSVYSLIATQVAFGLVALGFLLYSLATHKIGGLGKILLTLLFFATARWWILSIGQPWNGHLYLPVVLASITSLWFRKSLYVSLLLFGTAVAIHPAALLITPIFIYEWFVYKTTLLHKAGAVVVAIVLPWLPIIAYEVITKGFLVRQFLSHHTSEVSGAFGLVNLQGFVQLSALPIFLLCLLMLAGWYVSERRAKIWWLSLLPAFVVLSAVSYLHLYYLLGLLVTVWFLGAHQLIRHRVGTVVLLCIVVVQLITLPRVALSQIGQTPGNRVTQIAQVITELERDGVLVPSETYAVVSVLTTANQSPQADDYRFFLRMKGYEAANIPTYTEATRLLVFFEYPEENPGEWRDWHTEQFGSAQLLTVKKYGNTTVASYAKSPQ